MCLSESKASLIQKFSLDQIAYIEETFGLRNDQCDNILNDFQKLRIIKIQVTRESFGFLKPTVLTKSSRIKIATCLWIKVITTEPC